MRRTLARGAATRGEALPVRAADPRAGRARPFSWRCLLGRHEAGADEVWHAGYGFAHCRRCGEAIVRSLLSDWQVPGPRFRVVWPSGGGRAHPPRSTRPEPPADVVEVSHDITATGPAGPALTHTGEVPAPPTAPPEDDASPILIETAPVDIAGPEIGEEHVPVAETAFAPAEPSRPASLLPDDFMGAAPSSSAPPARNPSRAGWEMDFDALMRNDDGPPVGRVRAG